MHPNSPPVKLGEYNKYTKNYKTKWSTPLPRQKNQVPKELKGNRRVHVYIKKAL
jgi:hypothetical protein